MTNKPNKPLNRPGIALIGLILLAGCSTGESSPNDAGTPGSGAVGGDGGGGQAGGGASGSSSTGGGGSSGAGGAGGTSTGGQSPGGSGGASGSGGSSDRVDGAAGTGGASDGGTVPADAAVEFSDAALAEIDSAKLVRDLTATERALVCEYGTRTVPPNCEYGTVDRCAAAAAALASTSCEATVGQWEACFRAVATACTAVGQTACDPIVKCVAGP